MAESSNGPLVITLDGPAGVGKTTLAKRLAQTLGVAYLDTGAMFRAVAHRLGQDSWEWSEERLAEALAGLEFSLSGSGAHSLLAVNGVPLGQEIRTEQVGMWGSNVARLPVVRDYLKKAQQRLGAGVPLVAEGRDMGTVVFPQAAVKFFLDAEPGERARRRWLQLRALHGKDPEQSQEELEAAIRARDDQDRNRAVAPLRPAEDAVMVDTTSINEDEVFQVLIKKIPRN